MSASPSPSSISSSSLLPSALTYFLRSSSSRGHANHGWLNTYHSFSFASYYDRRFNNYYSLRVLNEDRVSGGEGFGTHGHANYEIFSYVVNGALLHRDSMNNKEIIKRGGVQFTSAGTGIHHSEYNANQKELVHFLQIWVSPNKRGLKPRYSTIDVNEEDKIGKLRLIVTGEEKKAKENHAIVINNDIDVYASILKNNHSPLSFDILPGRALYIHLVQDVIGFGSEGGKTGLKINGGGGKVFQLKNGDGLMIDRQTDNKDTVTERITIEANNNDGDQAAEFLIFDVRKNAPVLDDD